MKKITALFLIGSLLTLSCLSQSIHSLSFNNIDGGNVSLSTYAGKKILIIIAPISSSDSSRLDELKKFQLLNGDSVKVIGIMSIEDGYSSGNSSSIKNLYESRGIDIVLTNGMYTKKSAGANQSSLMKWLTEKNENSRYDIDARGIWQKFVINKMGKLYGVVGSRASLFDGSIGWILYREM